ncbi:MAG: 50S ribosomal protein L22 [Candidatus Omnitrophota bacterium]|jgi:large subunit ribosomal protein L22
MITRAETRYIRITPRKFRQIIPLVKGKNPEDAIAILMGMKKKASMLAIDLISAAIANAKRIQGLDIGTLYISRMVANCGPSLKRFRAGSMGRASMIKKRTSHIIVELDEMPSKPADEHKEAVKKESKVKKEVSPKENVKEVKEKITKKKPAAAKK